MFVTKLSTRTRTQATNVNRLCSNVDVSFESLIRLRQFLQENDRKLKLYRLGYLVMARRGIISVSEEAMCHYEF